MPTPKLNCSFQPLPASGIDDLKDTGSNSHENEFATGPWSLVMTHYKTFTAQDFFSLTKSLDLEPQEVKALTQKYIRKALKSGHIVLLQSVDEPVFQVV
ncbi:MAG TPA: hypothetical protein P5205_20135 [Candidatus Paceibacterota bacterium]|nr:hypothetical protein [Verrucomicrobiota bacterium]HSA12676.1 hypothetical protein [Candidatus Paceibacterota bacterium]